MKTAPPAPMPQWMRWATGALLVLALLPFYRWCWSLDAPDLSEFLVPWYRHILDAGRWHVFAAPFSNYSPPYLYALSLASWLDGLATPATVIRALSLVITAMLASAMARMLREAGRRAEDALLLFALPSAIINAAMLGQCDALWAAPCLMAVRSAMRREPVPMLAWCGIAFAVKAQAVFFAPFAFGALLAMRPRWHHWLAAPAVWFACMAPALLAGWPLADLLTVYLRQSQEYPRINLGAANLWLPLGYLGLDSAPAGFAAAYPLTAAAALGCAWATFRATRTDLAQADWLALALLPALAMPFVMPMMHERYFFLADVLSLALALAARDGRSISIAIATQLGSTLALFAYVTGESAAHLHQQAGFGLLGTVALVANAVALVLAAHRVWTLASRRPTAEMESAWLIPRSTASVPS